MLFPKQGQPEAVELSSSGGASVNDEINWMSLHLTKLLWIRSFAEVKHIAMSLCTPIKSLFTKDEVVQPLPFDLWSALT